MFLEMIWWRLCVSLGGCVHFRVGNSALVLSNRLASALCLWGFCIHRSKERPLVVFGRHEQSRDRAGKTPFRKPVRGGSGHPVTMGSVFRVFFQGDIHSDGLGRTVSI